MTTPTIVLTGKSLTLQLGLVEYHQQTTLATVTAEPVTEEVAPLGVDPVTINTGVRRTLSLTALQDWPEATSLCALLEDAAESGEPIAFTLELTNPAGDTATASGTCQGVAVPFGGEAGVLTSEVVLPVLSWAGIVRTAAP